jgi:hypothetical protein
LKHKYLVALLQHIAQLIAVAYSLAVHKDVDVLAKGTLVFKQVAAKPGKPRFGMLQHFRNGGTGQISLAEAREKTPEGCGESKGCQGAAMVMPSYGS